MKSDSNYKYHADQDITSGYDENDNMVVGDKNLYKLNLIEEHSYGSEN
jgi:hypothetical protein